MYDRYFNPVTCILPGEKQPAWHHKTLRNNCCFAKQAKQADLWDFRPEHLSAKGFFFKLPAGTKTLQVPGKVLHAESSPQSNSLMLPATAGYIGVYYFYLCNTTCTKTKTGFQKCGFSNMVKDSFSQLLGTSLAGRNLSKISE